MNIENVLQQIQSEELTSQEAYNLLYPEKPKKPTKPGKRAHFIKMKIHVPEEGKGINTFLRILFALPIPMIFARIGLRIGKKHANVDEVDFDEIARMLKYSRGTKVSVDTDDAKVEIKVI